jgi:hypothetical protein
MATTKTTTAPGVFTGLFDQAFATFGDTLKAGLKIQDDVGRWWTDALATAAPGTDWQKRARIIFNDTIPAARKNADQWIALMEKNYKRSAELLKRAFDGSEPLEAADLREKLLRLWEDSLALIKENTQALTEANVKMLELWADAVKKSVEGVKTR